jgi:hypothetical protein
MIHKRNRRDEMDDIQVRVLLAFALNRTSSLTAADLIMAAGICQSPVDETPVFEAVLDGLALAGVIELVTGKDNVWNNPLIRVIDASHLPQSAAAYMRRRMSISDEEPGTRLSVLAIPGPLADVPGCDFVTA